MAKCAIFETMVTFMSLWFYCLYLVIPIFCFLEVDQGVLWSGARVEIGLVGLL
jgi:hypothetical protein